MGEGHTSDPEFAIERTFRLGDIAVDTLAGELRGPGGREQIDPKVMAVLCVLVEHPRRVVLREELLARVWPDVIVTDDALSRCVYQLRRHLIRAGGSARYREIIETLPKRGYRLNFAPNGDVARQWQTTDRPSPPRESRRFGVLTTWTRGALVALLGGAALAIGAAAWISRSGVFWRDPLAGARFTRLTDFEGVERDATISADGRSVAFLADRGGTFDVWATELGSGRYVNLTRGRVEETRNADVRTLSFAPDGNGVLFWTRLTASSVTPAPIHLWTVPTQAGEPRMYREGVAEVAWSLDGTKMLYRTPESGDPLFVAEGDESVGRRIFAAPEGLHNHFPLWSPDGAFVYFVHGRPPDDTDIWRVAAAGGPPERITFHSALVRHPVFLDDRRLLYLATDDDASGPWLHALDTRRRTSHRVAAGLQPMTSLAASADGRRLVATVTTPRTSLWRVPLDAASVRTAATRIDLPTNAVSPRLRMGSLFYVAGSAGTEGLWRLVDGEPREVVSGRNGRVVAGPALEPIGERIVFVATRGGSSRLYVVDSPGAEARALAPKLDVRGAPAWSPDKRWIAVAADRGGGPQLFKVPLDGSDPVPLVDDYSIDPAWSLDGRFIVYRGEELGPSFTLRAVTADGRHHPIPALTLPRGSRRFPFVSASKFSSNPTIVVLKGELQHKNFWLVDLTTGSERQLTNFGQEFVIGDFDVSADGREIVFDRLREESDVVLFEWP